jgi:LmbE family N-acetylglucosaminyl deacetylase
MSTHLLPTDLGTILSIWAHPDDETYLAGGLMAAAVAAGQRVVCVSATAGEHGTSDPEAWPPERLGQVRRWEAAAAMAVLGVSDHRWMGLPDGALADVDSAVGVAAIVALIEEVEPDTILTFGPDGVTFHADHRTISTWVTDAWRATGCRGCLLHQATSEEQVRRWGRLYEEWGVFMTTERPVGRTPGELAVSHRPTGAALDQKMTALRAMATQTGPAVALMGEETFAVSNAPETFVAVPAEVAAPAREGALAAR